MKYRCIRDCQARIDDVISFYKVGTIIDYKELPNHHFEEVNDEKKVVIEPESKPNPETMSKPQINEVFNLGLTKSQLVNKSRAQVIALAKG